MASTSEVSSLSVHLLLLALLSLTPTGAGADEVTRRECKQLPKDGLRMLDSPSDNNATMLYLYNCNTNEIRRGDFDGLPNIESIELGNDDILLVDPAAFKSVQKLTSLSLWLTKLRELPVFDEPSMCPSLTKLSSFTGQLTVIQHARTFSACVHLEDIYLYYNEIEYLHPEVFTPLIHLNILLLNNNKLTYIPNNMFKSNIKLENLGLYNNRISYLPANFDAEFRNADARLTHFLFYNNPWHCACLLELLADLKLVGKVTYQGYDYWNNNIPLYDGTRPVCVYSGAYPCSRHAPSGLLRAPPRAPANSSNSP